MRSRESPNVRAHKKSIRKLDHGVGIPLPPSNRAGEGYQYMPTPPGRVKLVEQIIEHGYADSRGPVEENVSWSVWSSRYDANRHKKREGNNGDWEQRWL